MEIKNKELINKIIDNLYVPKKFGIFDELDYDDPFEFIEFLEDLRKIEPNVVVETGATKCVILLDSNMVIKIPMSGRYLVVDRDYDEDEDYEYEFKYYSGANDTKEENGGYPGFCYDYCANELYKYIKAVEDGFGEFFAETMLYKNKSGKNFYLQEKIITFDNYENSLEHSEKSKRTYESLNRSLKSVADSDWMQNVIDYYGVNKALAFFEYIYENQIDRDLHLGNLGYRKNGAPVLFDIAGYRS